MKTTVQISDSLLLEARKLAKSRDTTLKNVLETALREYFRAQTEYQKQFKLKKHSVGGKGLQKGLSFDDSKKMNEMIYGS